MKKKEQILSLATEQQNTRSADLDTKSAIEIARIINAEDATIADAVKQAVPQIARAIDAVAKAIGNGGRLIYVGCGTSGRIAALDASEIPPTFNLPAKVVQYVIAGGDRALGHAAEFNEDSRKDGERDVRRLKPSKNDVVIGLAASGRTPYTIAAVDYAKSKGAITGAIVCNPGSELGRVADIEVVAEVGPEVVSGSTRMKAGTAQKLICNMITTGAMARLGYVYGNLMVNVHLKNEKLVERGTGILMKAAGVDHAAAKKALRASGDQVPVALVMLKTRSQRKEAERRLAAAKQNVRRAIESSRDEAR
jgi:N-acetylmuramic acid 6-phosphate etherase